MKILTFILLSFCFFSSSFAQTQKEEKPTPAKESQPDSQPDNAPKKGLPPVPSSEQIRIEYGSSSWNKSSEQIDTAFLFIRDKESKKILKVFLDESAPDSSIFKGVFSLSFKNKKVSPEVFIPPQKLRSEKEATNFNKLLSQGKVEQKPVFFRTDEGKQIIDVFDNKQQLDRAKKAYAEKQKALKAKASLVEAIPKKQDLEAQERAEELKKQVDEKVRAAQLQEERIRLQQIEEQKRKERLERQKKLAEKERARRMAQAKLLSEQGEQAFKAGDFVKAQDLFEQSIDLNPEDKSYYFNYAVALYRNNKINEAQVIFKNIEKEKENFILKRYYLGLIHYRLEEYKMAGRYLRSVQKSKSELAPSASFYIGIIYFTLKKWDRSQKEFEWVLDNSKDPKLDKQAEAYIENIALQKQYAKLLKYRNDISLTFGYMYDSNILLTSNSTGSSSGSGVQGSRYLAGASYGYRAIYNKENSLSFNYDTYYVYSENQSASAADPFLNTITIPYNFAVELWGKAWSFTVTPGYEALFMEDSGGSSAGSGVRENILNSYYATLKALNTNNPSWFSSYSLDIRQDDSSLSTSTGDEDQDALKVSLTSDQSFFFDSAKKEGIVANVGLISNNAVGKNKRYNKINLGATYVGALSSWEASWSTGLTLYQSSYDSTDGRIDINATLSASLTKPWTKAWSSSLVFSASSNNSTVAANSYDRNAVTLTGTYKGAF